MTKLYPTSDATALYTPATLKGGWEDSSNLVTMRLHTSLCGDVLTVADTENNASPTWDVALYRGVSDPLRANTTIAGTLDYTYASLETNADADFVLHLHVWVTTGDSDTVRGTLLADFSDSGEWVANGLGQVSGRVMTTQTLSSVAAQAGDRIVVEAGYRATNTHTTSRGGTLTYGGARLGELTGTESLLSPNSTGGSFFTFSADLVFAPTYVYFANAAAPATPAANRGTWDLSGSAVNKALARSKSGAELSNLVSETSATPVDVLNTRFVSEELAAQTIAAGTAAVVGSNFGTVADADAFAKYHLYVMQSDGSVRGTLAANVVQAVEATVQVFQRTSLTLSSVSVSAGDRLVLEAGHRFSNVLTASRHARVYSGNTLGDASDGGDGNAAGMAGWLRFPQRIVWLSEAAQASRTQIVSVG
ncbi:MAG TPA: hypothetical protein VH475_26520 [Tepidisphaeraceae bacterium]|jgi:hypothetical protein